MNKTTIHLITAGKYQNQKDWPEVWNKCFNTWAQTHHDLSIWTDVGIDKLLQEDDKEFYDEYLNKLHPIYKWDYVRYIILEKYGGIYVDMDVELIDDSFFKKLHPEKIYLMEGTGGTYIENSIMISPPTKNNCETWKRVKSYAKNRVIKEFNKCDVQNSVIWVVGPQLISEFFLKQIKIPNPREWYDILAWEHFSNPKGTINFTKHYQTQFWNK